MRFFIHIALLHILFVSSVSCVSTDQSSFRSYATSEGLSVRQLCQDIWVHTSVRRLDGGFLFPANGLIVRSGDDLILVDTAWGEELTVDLLSWIEREIGSPVTKAIVTHFHDDSMGGVSVLEKHGIPVLANSLTRTIAKSGARLQSNFWPKECLSGQSIETSGIEVFYPGPSHSEDLVVVWISKHRVLFGSCAIRSPTLPGLGNVADANTESWPLAVQRVLQRYPNVQKVVPGHGPPGDALLLHHTIELFSQ